MRTYNLPASDAGHIICDILCSCGWVYAGLWLLGAPGWLALVACVTVTAGLRLMALWRNWELPAWRV